MKNTIALTLTGLFVLFFIGCAEQKSRTNTLEGNPMITFNTNVGSMVLELDKENAPITTANFISYVEDGYFNGLIFHRVIPGFMIQGGGFTENMQRKQTKPPIINEASNGLKNLRGTISMARTSDPDSATSQFFINVADNPSLDYAEGLNPGYAVFGKVIEGMDVADKIVSVKTTTKGIYQDVPIEPIMIISAEVTGQ